jgi:LPXTG-motif cell wall-anchored protein
MLHGLHLFGGRHALVWKYKLMAVAITAAIMGLLYVGLAVWVARRRRKAEEEW